MADVLFCRGSKIPPHMQIVLIGSMVIFRLYSQCSTSFAMTNITHGFVHSGTPLAVEFVS